jgi:putative NADH-flavin reductase
MKVVVLGATGGTGLEIVRQAIEHGHSVTAFVRSPERLKPFANRITLQQGDLLNTAELAKAIAGHDAILSGFGPRVPIAKSDANLLRNFASALTTAMHQANVRRAVIVSTAFLFKDSILPPTYLFGRLFFPGVVIDASAMERIIMASGLDWTIVRPPQLTDKPFTGKYRVRTGRLPGLGFKISRADVAHSFLKTVEDPASIKTVVGVSN